MITSILPNMVIMRNINTILETDKLFYELGYKRNVNASHYGDNWIRTGNFKEIKNVKEFLENDKRLSDLEYLEHHNFMIIKLNK
jgi:hypothetical protein